MLLYLFSLNNLSNRFVANNDLPSHYMFNEPLTKCIRNGFYETQH